MRNWEIVRIIPLLITVCFLSLPAEGKYSGGTGEPNDPYRIATAEDLMLLGESPEDYDKHFILTADIDLDPNLPDRKVFDRAVIAPDLNDEPGDSGQVLFEGTPFTGVFDGSGHTISHLMITGEDYVGLFGEVGSGARISNLGLQGVDVSGTGFYVGGLVGHNSHGSITSNYSGGVVSGCMFVGGLVGDSDGNVTGCYSTGTVSGRYGPVGGLIGNSVGNVTNCYSTGMVSAEGWGVGGLVGVDRGTVRQSFWDIQRSGLSTSAAGVGRTTAQMQSGDTFMCWAADGAWTLDEGKDYPRLWWEDAPGLPLSSHCFGGGTGVEADPYLIYTADQLNLLGILECHWDKHFQLVLAISSGGIV